MTEKNNPVTKALLALRGMVVLPGMVVNLDAGRDKSINSVEAVMDSDHLILLVTQREAEVADVNAEDLYEYGTLAEVKQTLRLPNGAVRVLVEGLKRVKLSNLTTVGEGKPYFVADYVEVQDKLVNDNELEALHRLTLESFEQWVLVSKKVNGDILQSLSRMSDVSRFADVLTGYLSVAIDKKQTLLETVDVKERLQLLYTYLTGELEIGNLQKDIAQEVHEAVERNQKEYYLREQIKVLNKELGDGEDAMAEAAEFAEQMESMDLPEEVRTKLNKELSRLKKMMAMSQEAGVIRIYVETVLGLPWGKFTEDNFDLRKAEAVLEREHYGLKKVKERILEFLAVRALSETKKGSILCFVGPPGVGKTSLAHSIAEAIGRKYTRVSLGGVRDEAEIRGHRRTYLGSMPGRIIHGMMNCGCMNPVFLLDEIDKLASDFRGDPASALLEALDPEQNNTFCDHFVELPFDLSNVFWIVTANTTETIPPALRDRMEIIELSSYTEEEKVKIAQLHLFPKERELNGLGKHRVTMSEGAIRHIIRDYTREAGVRNLERKIAAVCRKIAYKIVHGDAKGAQVTDKNLEKYLGKAIFMDDDINMEAAVGGCNGLAWTSVGGELLRVEVLTYKGKGGLTLTGQLGDVMKESAQAGLTYIRSRAEELHIPADFFENHDVHIHLPEGAVPKDGPSAGVTMITAMVSAITGRKVKAYLAMTGEISLSGQVIAVGGIKEKMLAAYRYGVKTILLPKRNLKDLEELPEDVRSQIKFLPMEHVDQVLQEALEPALESAEK